MWMVIIVLVVIIIIYFAGSNAPDLSAQNEGLLHEIIDKLKIVQDFTNSSYWDDNSGLVMLIPVNANGEKYGTNSDRIEISMLLYEDDTEMIKLFTQTKGILDEFELVNDGGSFMYKTNTLCTFNCGYKAIMNIVNKHVVSEFPNVQFEFDGSRVLTNKMNK